MLSQLGHITLTLACSLCVITSTGQEAAWSVDFATHFENREGGDELRPDQTFLFTRLSPEVGIRLAGHDSASVHLLKGGVNWLQPMCDDMDGHKVLPSLYYSYTRRHAQHRWQVELGWVPRTELTERVARYLWSDSLDFTNPAIRGAIVKYTHNSHGGIDFYLDWRQMQSSARREAFNVLANGRWYPSALKSWWVGGAAQYNHLAKRKNAPDNEGVNDDITINPMAGWHTGTPRWGQDGWTEAWSLSLKAGAVVNMERARADGKWHTPAAFVGSINASWRWLEATEDIAAGSDLMPLWNRFGSQLNLGDTYYKSKFYSRTQLRAHIVQRSFVDLNCALTFHATDKTTGLWQSITCRIYIDHDLWRHHGKSGRPLTPAY